MRFVVAWYVAASLATFAAYGWDKRAAIRGTWRVAERRLHLLELLGGFPGGLLGQRLFRHKRRKTSYLVVFWLIILVHIGLWTAWLMW